jgi:hypothetical protein
MWLFGLFTDSYRLFGYKRRGHLLVASALQTLFSIAVFVSYKFDTGDTPDPHHAEHNEDMLGAGYPPELADYIWFTTSLIFMVIFSRTWMGPVIEEMMIVEIKKDIVRGAEDVETYAQFWYAMGVFIYGFGAALIFRYTHYKQDFFIISAFVGLSIFITSLLYNEDIEAKEDHHAEDVDETQDELDFSNKDKKTADGH